MPTSSLDSSIRTKGNEGRVLLVEDDPTIQRLLKSHLTSRNWEIDVVRSGKLALEIVAETPPDLILLDIGVDEIDGLEVCRQLREWSSIPIILVTAADTPRMKITALELGADDYLTKPFHTGELIARMRAVLRRSQANTVHKSHIIEVGTLTIDFIRREVRRSGEDVKLTKIEFGLLKEFVQHLDHVLTYSYLLNAVWGEGYDDFHLVHVHVSHLRRKLEPDIDAERRLFTVQGVGYKYRGE